MGDATFSCVAWSAKDSEILQKKILSLAVYFLEGKGFNAGENVSFQLNLFLQKSIKQDNMPQSYLLVPRLNYSKKRFDMHEATQGLGQPSSSSGQYKSADPTSNNNMDHTEL